MTPRAVRIGGIVLLGAGLVAAGRIAVRHRRPPASVMDRADLASAESRELMATNRRIDGYRFARDSERRNAEDQEKDRAERRRSVPEPTFLGGTDDSVRYKHRTVVMEAAARRDMKTLEVTFSWPTNHAEERSWTIPSRRWRSTFDCGEFESGPESDACFDGCVCAYPVLLYVDESMERALVAIPMSTGQNVPGAVVEVNLKKRTLTYLFTHEIGSGVGGVSVSPDRRFIAYELGNHSKDCNGGSRPWIFDRRDRTNAPVPLEKMPWTFSVLTRASKWTTPGRVVFDQIYTRCDGSGQHDQQAVALAYDVASPPQPR